MLITVLIGITGKMKKTEKIIVFGIFCIILTFCLLFTTVEARFQQPYIIVGHVYDDSGNKSAGVEVTLTNIRTADCQTIITNDAGEYLFECLNFKQGYENRDKLTISCICGSQEVIIDTSFSGIQCPINKPPRIPVEPIIAGTILVAAAGGAYYYLKRKKKKFIKEEKQKEVIEGKMAEEEEKEKKENPLWLPEGSIRAILAIIALTGVIICVAMGIEAPEYLKTIVGMIIAFFFGGHTSIKK